MNYPHGKCECPHPNPVDHTLGQCPGPAAHLVVRDGKDYRLCTRCDLSTDQNRQLLIKSTDDLTPFLEWDDFGLAVVLRRPELLSPESVEKAIAEVAQTFLTQN